MSAVIRLGYVPMALTLVRWRESPEDDLGSWGEGCPVGGFLGAEAAAGSFLGAGVGARPAGGDEVAVVGDLGDQIGDQVGQLSGGKAPRRH